MEADDDRHHHGERGAYHRVEAAEDPEPHVEVRLSLGRVQVVARHDRQQRHVDDRLRPLEQRLGVRGVVVEAPGDMAIN